MYQHTDLLQETYLRALQSTSPQDLSRVLSTLFPLNKKGKDFIHRGLKSIGIMELNSRSMDAQYQTTQ